MASGTHMVPGDSHLESTAKQGNEITAQNVSRGLNMGHSSYVTETLRDIVSTSRSFKVCLHMTSPYPSTFIVTMVDWYRYIDVTCK